MLICYTYLPRLPRRFSQNSMMKQAARKTIRYVNASIGYSSSRIHITASGIK
ncbi:hypothetical protein M2105_003338 [Paenibacillus sp. PastF-1]|nr:hypothetical protein [Paenibacillus sp. PastF-2]MDF9848906.1 hypothetical protein [Paenibacillus sp. PastM-2]MDF9855476.1 hypothetical protein [Paenibacillus sp. PastF-1]MDH6480648.1 hypothetical protein [Paenibacillus sp. PastH-2]MDH6508170.1 hypothetical protein [Paenibacillus sp. PastM-3]